MKGIRQGALHGSCLQTSQVHHRDPLKVPTCQAAHLDVVLTQTNRLVIAQIYIRSYLRIIGLGYLVRSRVEDFIDMYCAERIFYALAIILVDGF